MLALRTQSPLVLVVLAALLLLVALETLHLFRQAKEAMVAGMLLKLQFHILLLVEAVLAQ